jgi:hypothetical protein
MIDFAAETEFLRRVKLRVLLRPFAMEVKQATGFCLKLPDEIVDKIPRGQEQLAVEILEKDFQLKQDKGGWTADK